MLVTRLTALAVLNRAHKLFSDHPSASAWVALESAMLAYQAASQAQSDWAIGKADIVTDARRAERLVGDLESDRKAVR